MVLHGAAAGGWLGKGEGLVVWVGRRLSWVCGVLGSQHVMTEVCCSRARTGLCTHVCRTDAEEWANHSGASVTHAPRAHVLDTKWCD
jgi:hypothetical protein